MGILTGLAVGSSVTKDGVTYKNDATNGFVVTHWAYAGSEAQTIVDLIQASPTAHADLVAGLVSSAASNGLSVHASDSKLFAATSSASAAHGYTHVQAVAALTWNVAHNLGYKPIVQAYDGTGGDLGSVDFSHIDNNTLTIVWEQATAGEARCA